MDTMMPPSVRKRTSMPHPLRNVSKSMGRPSRCKAVRSTTQPAPRSSAGASSPESSLVMFFASPSGSERVHAEQRTDKSLRDLGAEYGSVDVALEQRPRAGLLAIVEVVQPATRDNAQVSRLTAIGPERRRRNHLGVARRCVAGFALE